MKKPLLLSFAVGVSVLLSAQAYIPVLNDNAAWDVFLGSAFSMCGYEDGGRWLIDGDTIIQGTDYKVMHRCHFNHSNFFCPPFTVDCSFIDWNEFYLREDTIAQQVYVLPYSTNTEELLYDFSLHVGDTLHSDYLITWGNPGDNVIIDIDTITLINGDLRRRFHLPQQFFFIEGIGGSPGIGNYMQHGLGVDYFLACYRENDVPFLDPLDLLDPLCVYALGTEDHAVLDELTIAPNPTSGQVVLEPGTNHSTFFQLFDLSGRSVFAKQLSQATGTIDLGDVQSGVYLVRLNGKHCGKLVVER